MDDEHLTREQRRSMLHLLEQAALHDYPNPERRGCPGTGFLRRLASDRKSIALDDPSLDHVASCSPCYREFISYRGEVKRKTITRRAALALGGAAAAGTVATLIERQHNQALSYEDAEIDLFNAGGSRGPGEGAEQQVRTPLLARKRLNLKITLPFTSPEGQYRVEVLDANGKPTRVMASGVAHIVDGKTTLRVKLDLTGFYPSAYKIGIRRVPYDWLPVPIEIR